MVSQDETSNKISQLSLFYKSEETHNIYCLISMTKTVFYQIISMDFLIQKNVFPEGNTLLFVIWYQVFISSDSGFRSFHKGPENTPAVLVCFPGILRMPLNRPYKMLFRHICSLSNPVR